MFDLGVLAVEFLSQLATQIGAQDQPAETAGALEYAVHSADPRLSFSLLRALGEGLQRAGSSLQEIDAGETVKAIFAQAAKTAASDKAPEAGRLAAIRLLGLTSYQQSGATLATLLGDAEPNTIQVAVVSTLGRFSEAQTAGELTQRWAKLKPQVRSEALAVLLSRPERIPILLQAIEGGVIQPGELTTAQVKFLRNHSNARVRQHLERTGIPLLEVPFASSLADVRRVTRLLGEKLVGIDPSAFFTEGDLSRRFPEISASEFVDVEIDTQSDDLRLWAFISATDYDLHRIKLYLPE